MSTALTAWVIYRAPKGYAPAYCARHYLLTATAIQEIEEPRRGDSLESLRAQMPNESRLQRRHENDPPLIVETWI